jgi:trigger factor
MVKEVKRQELPELNDEFAKSVGGHASLDALKSHLKEQIEKERETVNHQWMEEQILTFLLNRFSFEVPKTWITRQAGFLLSKFERDQNKPGAKVEEIPLAQHPQKKVFEELAERQIKSMLIIDEIAKLEGISVTPEDLAAHYEKFSKDSGATAEQVQNFYESNQEQMNALTDDLLRSKTLAFLREHAVVEWVKEEEEKTGDEEKKDADPEEGKGMPRGIVGGE